jgi:hypothetical protein
MTGEFKEHNGILTPELDEAYKTAKHSVCCSLMVLEDDLRSSVNFTINDFCIILKSFGLSSYITYVNKSTSHFLV